MQREKSHKETVIVSVYKTRHMEQYTGNLITTIISSSIINMNIKGLQNSHFIGLPTHCTVKWS